MHSLVGCYSFSKSYFADTIP